TARSHRAVPLVPRGARPGRRRGDGPTPRAVRSAARGAMVALVVPATLTLLVRTKVRVAALKVPTLSVLALSTDSSLTHWPLTHLNVSFWPSSRWTVIREPSGKK